MANQSKPTHPNPSEKRRKGAEPDLEQAPARLNGDGSIGVIDIGSNSVRLIVYERLSRISTPLFNEKDLCGLARGMEASGRLDPAAAAAALATMRRFRALCDQIGVTRIHVLATAASREASNGKDFITAVEAIIGAPIQLLTGGEEARLTALGVISGIPGADGIAGDMGGGSLEIVDIRDGEVGSGESFALGGLRLQDAAEGAIKRAEKVISEVLSRSSVLKDGEGRDFYAIGGTWRSLARLQMRQKGYPLHVMHEYKLDAAEAADFCRMVARREVDSLDSIDVVSRNRRSLLPYGAAVLEQIVKVMNPKRIVMSALGVREGHLYDLLPDDERIRDPLIVACEELAWLRSRSPRHAGELIPWSAQAFQAIGLDETSGEVRLRHAACLLADIGWRVHPDYRGEQSLNLIAHASFIGIDHPGRAYLALANFYRHEGLIDEALSPGIRELAPTRYMERARALGAILRTAYLISGAMPGVVGRTRLERRGKALALVLPQDLAPLGGSRVARRLGQIAKTAGLAPVIDVE